jgi:hypothetical protein
MGRKRVGLGTSLFQSIFSLAQGIAEVFHAS